MYYWYLTTPYATHAVGSGLVIILTFSYRGITWWGTVSVSGLTGEDDTM